MGEAESKFLSRDTLFLVLFIVGIFVKYIFFIYLGIAFIVLLYFSLKSWKTAWVLFTVGFVLGFFFEILGTHTCFPFGCYYYDRLALQYAGISIYVPIMWGIYTFETYLFARQITVGWKTSILVAILLVILDLTLDPFMTSWKAWVWVTKTEVNWFGVPWTNFVGWFIVSAIIVLTYLGVIYKFRDGKEEYNLNTTIEVASLPYLFDLLSFYLFTIGMRENLASLCSLGLAIPIIIIFIIYRKRMVMR